MYTGEAKVNFSTARDLIVAADYLIILSASNCCALESFASQYHCESLEQATSAYQSQNFTAVVETDDFKALEFEKI